MLNINRFQHNINLWAAGFSRICAGGSNYGGLKAGRMLYRAGVRAIRVILYLTISLPLQEGASCDLALWMPAVTSCVHISTTNIMPVAMMRNSVRPAICLENGSS